MSTHDHAASSRDDVSMRLEERERILEHQLGYLYDEVLQLKKERYEITYTASWLLVRPLLRAEEALVGFVRRLFARGSQPAAPAAGEPARPVRAETRAAPPRRILVDVTGTVLRDMGTGIERMTKDLSQALRDADPETCLLVRCENGGLLKCEAPIGSKRRDLDSPMSIEPGDQLLILADAWNYPQAYDGVFDAVHAGGGRVIVCVPDVIPELYPAACHERTVELYQPWLRDILLSADGVLCISRAARDDLLHVVAERSLPHRPQLPVDWFHIATRFEPRPDVDAREKIRQLFEGRAHVFLCVGTFEPRKGQLIAVRAFEQLWEQGDPARLVFVGRRGWFDYALAARILNHVEYGRRLFWFDDVKDDELSFLYTHMSALVYPSFAEGFGLPIVEASRCGKPVICSDIPVFREVGAEGAIYFPLNDPSALAQAIRHWEAKAVQARPDRVLGATWAEAAARIIETVRNDRWEYRLP
ncbi:MAG: glycosyltransferase family 4 protein [Methylocystis sp.]|uniref:glycosyltransferase family 4 protein n=1 Tax=Methylocystis sp. TaxID=1911079 RepID=UPI003DA5807A